VVVPTNSYISFYHKKIKIKNFVEIVVLVLCDKNIIYKIIWFEICSYIKTTLKKRLHVKLRVENTVLVQIKIDS
jgi:hypothetical protein